MADHSAPLTVLLATRRHWMRKHAAVGLICGGALVLLAALLVAGITDGFASGHPGAIVLDAALMGLLLSLVLGSVANAWSAWRFGARIAPSGAAVACRVRRLTPESRMRKDYLLVTAGGRTVLVRCSEDAPTASLAEVIDGSVLGWPTRRGGIVLVLPHVGLLAATVGRYHRHLPKALRSDYSAGRLASD
ncbi:hypothetical protein acdb102_44490 [Acidothermaceae bacterium B102]|nr:hypothetical protein acdb102_44490 [Acidothermaceae bacterium B102]